jgi:hypothetical protein
VLLVLAYPLSYGPVFALCARRYLPWFFYGMGYVPIFWLESHHESIDGFFDWYQEACYTVICNTIGP